MLIHFACMIDKCEFALTLTNSHKFAQIATIESEQIGNERFTAISKDKKPTVAVSIGFCLSIDKYGSHRRECMHCCKDICSL